MTVQEILIMRNKIFISNGDIHTRDQLELFFRFEVQLGLIYSLSHPGKVVILQSYFLVEGLGCINTEQFGTCLESKSI